MKLHSNCPVCTMIGWDYVLSNIYLCVTVGEVEQDEVRLFWLLVSSQLENH